MTSPWQVARRLVPAIPPVPAEALGAFHVSVGVAILAGGGRRFSGPGWAGARVIAPWWAWGALLAVAGVCVLWGWPWLLRRHARAAVAVAAAGSIPLVFLTVGFFYAVHASPVAATSGIGAYGSLAAAHLHLAAHMIRAGTLDRRGPHT